MPELSDEERIRRQRSIDFARGSVQLSGGGLTPETEALNARYIAGELSDREHTDAVIAHAKTVPKGEPRQEYFTGLEDAPEADATRRPTRPDLAMSSPSGRSGRARSMP